MATTKRGVPAGFERATIERYTKHRLIGLSAGEPGSRKTTFWLEAPGPIAVFSLDQGLEGVVNRVLDENPDKEIMVWEREWFPTKDEDLQEKAIALRDELIIAYEAAVSGGYFRTVVIDKETDVWALFRYAEFGNEANGEQRDYDALNARYRRLINMGKASDCNLGFIEGLKDHWGEVVNSQGRKGKGPTGNRVPAGFKELPGLVHLCLYHEGVGEDWSFKVGKVRGPGALSVAGQEYKGLSFPEFAMLVFPDSDESEWI